MISPRPVRCSITLAWGLLCCASAVACYDVDGDPAGPPDSSGPMDSGGAPDTAVGTDSSSGPQDTSVGPADGGGPDAPLTDSGALDSAPADGGTVPACPNVYGAFSMMTAGLGCGDLDPGAPQRIDGDRVGCSAAFTSSGGINGTAAVGAAGHLAGASLALGTAAPATCSGTWTVATSTMTVVCGAGPSRCSITLSRTGP